MKPSKYSDFAHIGPGTLAGRFIRHFWQPVYVGADLKPGHPVRIQVLGEYFTLYRGDSGTPYVLEDRCPHRQTSLALGSIEGDCIRCFYHGWKFDGHGQCTEQPAEKANFAAKVKARAYPTEEYLGLIFAYLGEGEAPALPRFPELEDVEGVLVANKHPVPCNYFQRIENDLDETHVHFVHRVSTDSYGLNELPEIDLHRDRLRHPARRRAPGQRRQSDAHRALDDAERAFPRPAAVAVASALDGLSRLSGAGRRREHDDAERRGAAGRVEHVRPAREDRARSAATHRGRARRQDPHSGYRSEISRLVRRSRQRRARGPGPHRRSQPRLARPIGQGHHPVAQALGAGAEEDRRRQAAEELAPAERKSCICSSTGRRSWRKSDRYWRRWGAALRK